MYALALDLVLGAIIGLSAYLCVQVGITLYQIGNRLRSSSACMFPRSMNNDDLVTCKVRYSRLALALHDLVLHY